MACGRKFVGKREEVAVAGNQYDLLVFGDREQPQKAGFRHPDLRLSTNTATG